MTEQTSPQKPKIPIKKRIYDFLDSAEQDFQGGHYANWGDLEIREEAVEILKIVHSMLSSK